MINKGANCERGMDNFRPIQSSEEVSLMGERERAGTGGAGEHTSSSRARRAEPAPLLIQPSPLLIRRLEQTWKR